MLTPAQQTIVKNYIASRQDLVDSINAGSWGPVTDALNAPYSPATKAWNRFAPVDAIHDAIDDTKYTPVDAPAETLIGLQRIGVINIKQMVVQTKLVGREHVDATKATLRASLKDGVSQVPAGASGANVNPGGVGGVNVLNACLRPQGVTVIEKLLSTGPQTTGAVTGEVLDFEGEIDWSSARLAWLEG